MRDPTERLRDTLEAIANIEGYLPRGREAFDRDELLQTWFLRQLQIIGEAARGVPDDVRVRAPDVPWSNIVGMRNILVHGYHLSDAKLTVPPTTLLLAMDAVLQPIVESLWRRDVLSRTLAALAMHCCPSSSRASCG